MNKSCRVPVCVIIAAFASISSVSGARIEGTVVDSIFGMTVTQATVTLNMWSAAGKWDWAWSQLGTATTAGDGSYFFDDLDSTAQWEYYRVSVSKTGYVVKTSGQFTLAGGTTKVVDFALKPDGSPVRYPLVRTERMSDARIIRTAGGRAVRIDGCNETCTIMLRTLDGRKLCESGAKGGTIPPSHVPAGTVVCLITTSNDGSRFPVKLINTGMRY